MASSELYVGLMAGTSLDGLDLALLEITADNEFLLQAKHTVVFPAPLKQALSGLCQQGEVSELGRLHAELGEFFGDHALEFLQHQGLSTRRVRAIGSHGQTVRHQPEPPHSFSLQIGDPNRIAAITGITTIADFRGKDIALGGQGAPLAPAFHSAWLHWEEQDRVVLNLGGMANLSLLWKDPSKPVQGFDTGPANRLLDAWHERHQGSGFDRDGQWARSGHVDETLLEAMLADPYLAEAPPKSTGRERFNLDWLTRHPHVEELAPADVQATLLAFTVESIALNLERFGPMQGELIACGGGVHNGALMEKLAQRLSNWSVADASAYHIDPDYVEAAAFAWLAHQNLNRLAGNLASVTGARRNAVLGGIYPPP